MKKLFLVSILLLICSLSFATSYPVSLDNCVGYWTFNSSDLYATDVFQDMSGNGNNGTSANTPVYSADQNSISNQSATLNGTSDKITVGNVGNIKSFSIWAYPTAHTRSIADFDGGTISVEIDASNNITATGWTAPTIYVNGIASDDISLNAWNFITVTSETNVNATGFVIGNEATWFVGNISGTMLFSSALTEDEVSKLYRTGRTTARMVVDARELVTNGDMEDGFTSGLADDWAKDASASDVFADETLVVHSGSHSQKITYVDGDDSGIKQSILTIGRTYRGIAWIRTDNTRTFLMKFGGATNSLSIPANTWTRMEYESVATANNDFRLFVNSGQQVDDLYYFDNVSVTDITSKATPSLQKDLVLDMPLTSQYTEASAIKTSGSLTIGRTYYITARNGEDFTADGSPDNNVGTIFTATGTNVTLDANDTVKEMNAVTKDRTPYENNGTVSGATLKFNGLVNAGAGIAYVNQDVDHATYTFRVKHQTTEATYMFASQNIAGSLGYGVKLTSDDRVQLIEDTGQIMQSAASYIVDDTEYQFKVTWSLSGNMVVYIKGGSFGWDSWTNVGNATDVTYTTSTYLAMIMTVDCIVSGFSINGEPRNIATATQSTGTWTVTGDAYDFDGTDDYISITDTDDLSFGDSTDDSPFSVSAWVNMADATNFFIVCKGVEGTNAEWKYFCANTDKIYFMLFDDSNNALVSKNYNTPLTSYENTWIHLVGTYDGRGGTNAEEGIKVYLNGVSVEDAEYKSGTYVAMENLTHDVWIGRYATIYLEGQIDLLKIYSRELSATEVLQLYEKELWRFQ